MTTYLYREDSGYDETFEAAGDDAAEAYAEQLLRDGDWNQAGAEKSFRVRAMVGRVHAGPDGTEDILDWRTVMVQFDPDEPGCTSPDGHDWQSPYGLVGGVRENPGVWAHGGGITVDEACVRCGAGSHRDTWDTDPANGETFESVAYRPAGHYAIEAA